MRLGAKIQIYNHALREARLKAGYTQKELADLIGVNVSIVSSLETLKRIPISYAQTSLEDIADLLGEDFDALFPQDYIAYLKEIYKNPELVKVNPIIITKEVSLQNLLENKEKLFLPEKTRELEDQIVESLYHEEYVKLLDKLPPRQREILQYRFGLNNKPQKSLKELAEMFGVTRERIRQIELKALSNLRLRAYKLRRNSCSD